MECFGWPRRIISQNGLADGTLRPADLSTRGMARPNMAAAGLSTEDIGVLLDAVAAIAERVELAFLWRPMLPDADDDMVLETAINGRADGIVTFNRRDFGPAKDRFGIAVLSPGEVVSRLERKE